MNSLRLEGGSRQGLSELEALKNYVSVCSQGAGWRNDSFKEAKRKVIGNMQRSCGEDKQNFS